MGRAYGKTPAELLNGPWEDLLVNTRCFLQGRREEGEAMRSAKNDGALVFPAYVMNRRG